MHEAADATGLALRDANNSGTQSITSALEKELSDLHAKEAALPVHQRLIATTQR